jgi:glycosyltransferase involved in cell wall biosynthesis
MDITKIPTNVLKNKTFNKTILNNNNSNYKNHPNYIIELENVKPIISLIIPTFFEEKMLGELLMKFNENIKQKYKCEIIVSDGGSTDKTIEIAKQYADNIIENNSGKRQTISEGRNCGAKVAQGEILIFLNADCVPDNIELFFENIFNWFQINKTNKNSKTSAIACKIKSFKEEEIFRDRIFYFIHNNYVKLLIALGIGMGRGECQIVLSDVFHKVGGYNSNLVAGEDFDLFRRIKKNGNKILFDENILINESPRRFRKYGYLKTIWYWTLNSLTVIFFNKSVSKDWETIR